ncbi:peptide-methionine (S)-S-oxide reductase [Marivirga lumbricoides]|uniref:Peptide methionine sulfoxide reductase MsrA n=1 Tax=Marivirga lumbricoides TaxID=1046115 RepID=A0A2T4DLY1_9BACT|nr:peptide-methionine (S)-S-oxide reductase [Marivirga lumbricoides]
MSKYYLLLLSSIIIFSCSAKTENQESSNETPIVEAAQSFENTDTAYFAGGCFWCVEASFDQIKGVKEAISGYSGGAEKNPTYKEVSYGKTNHAEAVMVIYDPAVISYDTLLDIFFTAHDPTQLNRQGPDVGKQYRSAIFYTNEMEKQKAQRKMEALAGNYKDKIVTELTPFSTFYKAEEYHQDYEEKNPNDRYIVNVSRPKIEKVAEKFKSILKD